MFAACGQPQSRSVGADGVITDIYPIGIKLTQISKLGPDGKRVSLADLAANLGDKKDEFALRNHFVYSPDGILRTVLFDMPDIGPNGEVVHHVEDKAGMRVEITGKHEAQQ